MALGAACTVFSALVSLAALAVLVRGNPATRQQRAFWISVYYTVPFALVDTLYCAVYLGHGAAYLVRYWYLSVFYLTPWLTFPPTAALLTHAERRPGPR